VQKKIKATDVERPQRRIKSVKEDQSKRLTEEEKMEVVMYYVCNMSYKATAERFNLTPSGVKYIVDNHPEYETIFQRQREKEAKKLFAFLSIQGKKFAKFCNVYFDLLSDEKTIRELWKKDPEKVTKMFAINVDKFLMLDKVRMSYGLNDEGDQQLTINVVRKEKRD